MKKVGVILGRIRKMLLTLQPRIRLGVFQSGQMGQTVNLLSFDFGGSNPSAPTTFCGNSSVDRALAFQAGGRGFEPRLPLSWLNGYAALAQW